MCAHMCAHAHEYTHREREREVQDKQNEKSKGIRQKGLDYKANRLILLSRCFLGSLPSFPYSWVQGRTPEQEAWRCYQTRHFKEFHDSPLKEKDGCFCELTEFLICVPGFGEGFVSNDL